MDKTYPWIQTIIANIARAKEMPSLLSRIRPDETSDNASFAPLGECYNALLNATGESKRLIDLSRFINESLKRLESLLRDKSGDIAITAEFPAKVLAWHGVICSYYEAIPAEMESTPTLIELGLYGDTVQKIKIHGKHIPRLIRNLILSLNGDSAGELPRACTDLFNGIIRLHNDINAAIVRLNILLEIIYKEFLEFLESMGFQGFALKFPVFEHPMLKEDDYPCTFSRFDVLKATMIYNNKQLINWESLGKYLSVENVLDFFVKCFQKFLNMPEIPVEAEQPPQEMAREEMVFVLTPIPSTLPSMSDEDVFGRRKEEQAIYTGEEEVVSLDEIRMIHEGSHDYREKRKDLRIEIPIPVSFRVKGKDKAFRKAIISNISEGGLFIRTQQPEPIGTVLESKINIGTDITIRPNVIVIRVDVFESGLKGMALRFTTLTTKEFDILKKFIKQSTLTP